jgi:hypothetical protein
MRESVALQQLESRQLFNGLPAMPLVIGGTEGLDVISVKYDAASDAIKWSVNWKNYSMPLSKVLYVLVDAKGGNDQVYVGKMTSGLKTFVWGGLGDDKVEIANEVSYLTTGNVSVDGGWGKDSLLVNSWNANTPGLTPVDDIYADRVHVGGFYGAQKVVGIDVNYNNVEDLGVNGQAWHTNAFYVHSTKWGTTTRIHNGFTGDNIFVGDGDIDKNINGDLSLGEYGYNAWITIDDTKATHGQIYKFKDNTLKTLQMRTISFPGNSNLTVNTSSFNDVVGVDGGNGFSLKWLNINTGFGNDNVTFGNDSLLLSKMNYCTFAINTGADQDKIYMDDGHANFGQVYHIAPGKFSCTGINYFNYWNTETFGVGGGMQENTFDVVPSWYTKYQLFGHGLQPNYANQPSHLVLGLNGVTNPQRKQTGQNTWTYSFGNRQSIEAGYFSDLPIV